MFVSESGDEQKILQLGPEPVHQCYHVTSTSTYQKKQHKTNEEQQSECLIACVLGNRLLSSSPSRLMTRQQQAACFM